MRKVPLRRSFRFNELKAQRWSLPSKNKGFLVAGKNSTFCTPYPFCRELASASGEAPSELVHDFRRAELDPVFDFAKTVNSEVDPKNWTVP